MHLVVKWMNKRSPGSISTHDDASTSHGKSKSFADRLARFSGMLSEGPGAHNLQDNEGNDVDRSGSFGGGGSMTPSGFKSMKFGPGSAHSVSGKPSMHGKVVPINSGHDSMTPSMQAVDLSIQKKMQQDIEEIKQLFLQNMLSKPRPGEGDMVTELDLKPDPVRGQWIRAADDDSAAAKSQVRSPVLLAFTPEPAHL